LLALLDYADQSGPPEHALSLNAFVLAHDLTDWEIAERCELGTVLCWARPEHDGNYELMPRERWGTGLQFEGERLLVRWAHRNGCWRMAEVWYDPRYAFEQLPCQKTADELFIEFRDRFVARHGRLPTRPECRTSLKGRLPTKIIDFLQGEYARGAVGRPPGKKLAK
jgi:hypothetical protein